MITSYVFYTTYAVLIVHLKSVEAYFSCFQRCKPSIYKTRVKLTIFSFNFIESFISTSCKPIFWSWRFFWILKDLFCLKMSFALVPLKGTSFLCFFLCLLMPFWKISVLERSWLLLINSYTYTYFSKCFLA